MQPKDSVQGQTKALCPSGGSQNQGDMREGLDGAHSCREALNVLLDHRPRNEPMQSWKSKKHPTMIPFSGTEHLIVTNQNMDFITWAFCREIRCKRLLAGKSAQSTQKDRLRPCLTMDTSTFFCMSPLQRIGRATSSNGRALA